MSPRIVEDDVDVLYSDDYHPYLTPSPPRRARSRARELVRRLRRWLVHLDPSGVQRTLEEFYADGRGKSLLDFGCGTPAFIDLARGRGWQTIGSDFSTQVVRRVAAAGHQSCLVDELWDAVPDGSVDAIRLNHVLEHLYDPRGVLERLARKLAAGGRIHIAVPNPVGISAMLFGEAWRGLEPRHVILYRPQTVAMMLRDAGLSQVTVVHEPTTKDLLGSLHNWWHGRREAHRRTPRMMGSRLANWAILPLGKAAALLGRGDRFHVFARR